MEVVENEEEIVIRHKPVRQWIFGGIFLLLFLFCYISLTYYLLAVNPNIEILIFANFIAFFLLILICLLISAPLTIITISRKTKSIDILRRRFYGSRMERFYFNQISKFKSYRNSSAYFLALVLANGKTTKLEIPLGERKENSKFIRNLNKFVKSDQ